VCQKVDQVEILQQQRTVLADTLGGVRVHDRTAITGSVDRSVALWHDFWFLLHCLPRRVGCIVPQSGEEEGQKERCGVAEKVIYGSSSSRLLVVLTPLIVN
jgi:hypothetical protein